MKNLKFKIGDKVIVMIGVCKGDIGTIIGFDHCHCWPYDVYFSENLNKIPYRGKDLILFESPISIFMDMLK